VQCGRAAASLPTLYAHLALDLLMVLTSPCYAPRPVFVIAALSACTILGGKDL
jgi:hypothetical protein